MSTRALAGWIAGLGTGGIPQRTLRKVNDALLDTLGAALYGSATPWASAVRDWAIEASAEPPRGAGVWGEPARTLPAADAALVNGVAAHAFELDDYHNVKIHPGAVVIPAALALAERIDASGEALMVALVAGYETMIRTAAAIGPLPGRNRGWHLTGVCGTLGAAAACASLLRLDSERTAWALGLGGTQSSGLFAFNADGAMSKRLHPGRAAHAGVLAAELAQRGFTGPAFVYESADGGLLSTISGSTNVAALTAGLGEHYLSDDVAFKPYSCCGSTHAYIDAARELRERRRAFDGVAIRAGVSGAVRVQCGFDYMPGTVMAAQMSLRYCIAVALLEGHALPAQFTEAKIADPAIVALAQRVELVADAELDAVYPTHMAGWVSAGTDRVYFHDPLGSAARPMDRAAVSAKFHALLDGTYAPAAVAAIEAAAVDIAARPARNLGTALRARRSAPELART